MQMSKQQSSSFSIFQFLWDSKAALLLIALNVLAFQWMQQAQLKGENLTAFMLHPGSLAQGQWWSLITSGFLHADVSHLVMNCVGIFVFGRVVENEMGFLKTLFIYFSALLISMSASQVIYYFFLKQYTAVIGASGAVMGLLSVSMLLAPFSITWEMILPVPTMFKAWSFLYLDLKGFLGGEADGVSHLAHLCGYVSVAVIAYLLSDKDKSRLFSGLIINVLSLIMFLYVLNRFFLDVPDGAPGATLGSYVSRFF